LPFWVWLSVVRIGFALSLWESLVAVHELSEPAVCAESARLKQKNIPTAGRRDRIKGATDDMRG